MKIQKTYIAKPLEVERKYYLIDAKDKILGRVAAKAAHVLRGKHKRVYTPHVDCGDSVIIINADKIRVTGKKLTDKFYKHFTGYPSGLKFIALGDMLKKRPTMAMKLAVDKMIPGGTLGDNIRKKLKIYAGDKHPHQAQKPIVIEVK